MKKNVTIPPRFAARRCDLSFTMDAHLTQVKGLNFFSFMHYESTRERKCVQVIVPSSDYAVSNTETDN